MSNTVRINKKSFQSLMDTMWRYSQQAGLGMTYGSERNMYEALGYKKVLKFEDYWNRYDRDGVAKRVVRAFPEACWSGRIQVLEKDGTLGKNSELNKQWKDLDEDFGVVSAMMEADVLSRIGDFGILLVGIKDGGDLSGEVGQGELLYLQPYSQKDVSIQTTDLEMEPKNPRYGLPSAYTITQSNSRGSLKVHWSRVIHIAEDMGASRIYGTPALKGIYNYLQDLETVGGGSAEMFWRGAFPGFAAEADPDTELTPESKVEMGDEMEKYIHGLQRMMRVQGVHIKQLQPQAVDPTAHAEVQYDRISGATGIPKRIVRGSERGELSSAQDEGNWTKRIGERISHHCSPRIACPLIRLLMKAGVMKEQKFRILWPDLMSLDANTQSQIAERYTRSLYNYARAPGANEVLPEPMFLRYILNFSDEQITEIGTEAGVLMDYSRKIMEMKAEFTPTNPKNGGTEPPPIKQEPGNGKEPKL